MISLLRQRVEEGRSRLSAAGELGAGLMLDMLRELMVSIPDSVSVDITDIRLDGDSIKIEGEADSFETVEKLLQNLSASGYFEDVRVKQADSLHGRVKFRVDIVK
jgi:Tfp pilus assembly protein PilN